MCYCCRYSEACASTLASTYSSGSAGERKVVTTDLRQICTSSHTGTSASAPLAAGIIALCLQVNPELSWRDAQHLTVRCAHNANLKANDWSVNAVGRNFSHSFGYGIMDASCMVWTTFFSHELGRNFALGLLSGSTGPKVEARSCSTEVYPLGQPPGPHRPLQNRLKDHAGR